MSLRTASFRQVILGSIDTQGVATGVASGQSVPVSRSDHEFLTFYLQLVGGPAGAGTILIEEASYNPSVEGTYTGTWSPIDTIDATTLTTNAQFAYHVPASTTDFVRVRISVALTVATLVVRMAGK